MRNIILSLLILGLFFSCSSPKKEEQKGDKCTKYACPMHPDKTSTKSDPCPVCNMEMVPIDSLAKDTIVALIQKK